jgi:hypothetical protein
MEPDRQPGEEYDLINWWGDDLSLRPYYSLIKEQEMSSLSSDTILQAVDEDPFDLNDKSKEAHQWIKSQNPAANAAVVMYCLSGLRFIKDKTPEQIKEIGFEIAMMGRQGFNTDSPKKNYHFASVPGKVFSGLEALAWMFTTWQKIDSAVDIGANFSQEYALAQKLHEEK